MVSIILQMQSSYEQQVADLQSQYAIVSRQLAQLTDILNTHFTSQMTAIQSIQHDIASISLPQQPSRPLVATTQANSANTNRTIAHVPSPYSLPAPSQPRPVPPLLPGLVAATPVPRGPLATPTPRQDYFDTPSHATFSPSQTPAATSPCDPYDNVEIKITPSSDPNKPPIVVPSSLDSVADVWEEYRYGRNGNPSLESVEVRWGPRWRRDYKVQRWFNKRKIIVSKIKQYIADGVDEQAAVHELQMMRRNRTLNWLSRELESHRKETKKQWKAAREAAIANKQAMLGSGAMPANLT